jgi:hypothetical protein
VLFCSVLVVVLLAAAVRRAGIWQGLLGRGEACTQGLRLICVCYHVVSLAATAVGLALCPMHILMFLGSCCCSRLRQGASALCLACLVLQALSHLCQITPAPEVGLQNAAGAVCMLPLVHHSACNMCPWFVTVSQVAALL